MIRVINGNQADQSQHMGLHRQAEGVVRVGEVTTLEHLAPGDQFKLAYSQHRQGILLCANKCSARVRMYGREKKHEFHTKDGTVASFTERAEPEELAPGTRAIKVGHAEDEIRAPVGTKEARMADKGLQVRWSFQVRTLKSYLDAENETMAEAVRARLLSIAREAEVQGIKLPKPSYEDAVFVGLEGLLEERATASRANGANGEKSPPALSRAKAKAEAREDRMASKKRGAAKAKPKAEAAVKPRAAKGLHDCLDGCGEQVAGRFKMGHDAKYKSLILQVQRGKLDKSKLPAKMRKELIFVAAGKGKLRCTNAQAKLPAA